MCCFLHRKCLRTNVFVVDTRLDVPVKLNSKPWTRHTHLQPSSPDSKICVRDNWSYDPSFPSVPELWCWRKARKVFLQSMMMSLWSWPLANLLPFCSLKASSRTSQHIIKCCFPLQPLGGNLEDHPLVGSSAPKSRGTSSKAVPPPPPSCQNSHGSQPTWPTYP